MRFFPSIFSAISIWTTRLVFSLTTTLRFLGLLPCHFLPDAFRALENGKMLEEPATGSTHMAVGVAGEKQQDGAQVITAVEGEQQRKDGQPQKESCWTASSITDSLGSMAGLGAYGRERPDGAGDKIPKRPQYTTQSTARHVPTGLGIAETQPTSTGSLDIAMPAVTLGQLAFSALLFVPFPMLVLDDLKTVVLANEAMGTMLGVTPENPEAGGATSALDSLRGQSLSQVGVDMVQDGRLVWINWEQFFDSLVSEVGAESMSTTTAKHSNPGNLSQEDADGEVTPTADTPEQDMSSGRSRQQRSGRSAVVEVIISRKDINRTTFDAMAQSKTSAFQTRAKMLITIFEVEGSQTYYSLTFTNTDSSPTRYPLSRKSVARTQLVEAAERQSYSGSNPASSAGGSEVSISSPSLDSVALSPSAVSLSSSPFPPLGPPATTALKSAPSVLQKIMVLKDALIDSTEVPVLAMWKDGSVTYPNRAARKLFRRSNDLDDYVDGPHLLPAWQIFSDDFSTELDTSEFPISVLLRTEEPFRSRKIGMYDSDGNKRVFDCFGELIRDEVTDEVLAGVVTCRDVTNVTQLITRIKEEDEERFKILCDAMPQLVWTTTAEGFHDFYNGRWYDYTGLTHEESLGEGWMKAFHPEDLASSKGLWDHCLRTGEPYVTEYRCLSKEGEWKWFIGRALPLRNKETGQIEKWFGTCTDANEILESRHEAKRTRQQLLSVIAHAQVTVFQVDLQRQITMLEGALIEDAPIGHGYGPRWYLGQNVYQVFDILGAREPGEVGPQKFLEPIETIITGQPTEDLQEHAIDGRFYRTRFLPVFGKTDREGKFQDGDLEGVIGVIMDVTELKQKEADIETQAREKQRLVASEAAAKEASKLKGQFLANMSHEIRTPITGVIGMAELMLDLELGDEQREYTENIYRSANALLTVINDILDFSKVESGRLDIEEVSFSLSVVVRDVNKMLGFAAERKNLEFSSDISPDIANDLVVMGDPGRVRQIITNLLTNSIKFTNQGFVKFSVLKEKETADTIEIRFVVEDTGIGIDEEVRKRLFQPFSQGDPSTARKFGGTGLGLTICKSLLELMQGRMTLESTIGNGTTATFWIPFNKPSDSEADLVRIDPLSDRLQSDMSVSHGTGSEIEQLLNTIPAEMAGSGLVDRLDKPTARGQHKKKESNGRMVSSTETSPERDRSQVHVLVVEDNAINQQIATKTIKKLGFSVAAAWNGREALDYLTQAQQGNVQKPNIILMDVQMPIIDGYKCTHLLRHHLPYKTYVQDVPIVAMTASAIQGDREKCRKAGMDDYLAKPVRGKILEKMLDRWSARHRRPGLASVSSEGSVMSDCSQAGEHCDNADIPCVEHDEDDYVGVVMSNTLEAAVTPGSSSSSTGVAGISPSLLQARQQQKQREEDVTPRPPGYQLREWRPTPPPIARSETEETAVPKKPPMIRNDSAGKRGKDTDVEMAATSRADKLFDAADARTAEGSMQVSHQLPHSLEPEEIRGPALTTANMAQHDKDEAMKFETREKGRSR